MKIEHEMDLNRVKDMHRQEVEALKAAHSHTQSVSNHETIFAPLFQLTLSYYVHGGQQATLRAKQSGGGDNQSSEWTPGQSGADPQTEPGGQPPKQPNTPAKPKE